MVFACFIFHSNYWTQWDPRRSEPVRSANDYGLAQIAGAHLSPPGFIPNILAPKNPQSQSDFEQLA